MQLAKIVFNDGIYCQRTSEKIVTVIAADYSDGASLIAEERDMRGDILSGDIFRCEACELDPCTREQWEKNYPPSDVENYSFDEMCVPNVKVSHGGSPPWL